MSFTIKEVTEESGFEMDRTSITKVMKFLVHSDEFLSNADQQHLEDYDLTLTLDEARMQKEVIPFFRSTTPLFYEFVLGPGQVIFLYVISLTARQINWQDWEITATFGLPEDNGQQFGGGGGWTGPSNGEFNSNEFTQVSFNCSAAFEQRQMGTLEESQRRVGLSGRIGVNKRIYPIGLSPEGIEGAEQPVRSFTFEVTQYIPPYKLTYEYTRRISRLVTCINSKPFFGFAPGSVMCVGTNANGHLFQNVPLTIQFEVRPNFKILNSGVASFAPLQDTYTIDALGFKVVDYSDQYDTYIDPLFPDTAIIHDSGMLPTGVHSGFSILSYRYAEEVLDTEQAIVRKPTDRLIYTPEEVRFVDFAEFLL